MHQFFSVHPSLWSNAHVDTRLLEKNIALNIWSFTGKVISLFFNKLYKLVIAFLSRSKHLLISWLQSQSTVILEPKKIKSVTASTFSPSVCHKVMGYTHTHTHTHTHTKKKIMTDSCCYIAEASTKL